MVACLLNALFDYQLPSLFGCMHACLVRRVVFSRDEDLERVATRTVGLPGLTWRA